MLSFPRARLEQIEIVGGVVRSQRHDHPLARGGAQLLQVGDEARDRGGRSGVSGRQAQAPLRIPVWLEKEEQARLEATLKDRRNLPINIFGNNLPRMTETHRRYELLFGLLLNSGAELMDIKALLGHESIATTQIYTNAGQERMEKVVARL